MYFSYRFGRLYSPGCVSFFASFPGAVILGLLGTTAQKVPPATPPPDSAGITGLAGYVAAYTVPHLAQLAAGIYLAVVGLSLLLMVVAVLGGLIWRPAHPTKTAKGTPAAESRT